jgi:hypothetical protein
MNPSKNENLRSFSQMLNGLEHGKLSEDLQRQVTEIIAALNDDAQAHGGNPTATLILTLRFDLKGNRVEVAPKVEVKLPKDKRLSTVFWVSHDNALVRSDPAQPDMFKPVPKNVQEKIDAETGEVQAG